METTGADSDIPGTVGFGLRLGVVLHTCVETVPIAGRFEEITSNVNSTAATLAQLQDILDSDRSGRATTQTLKGCAIREIEFLADQCDKTYGAIVILLRRGLVKGGPEYTAVDPKKVKITEFIGPGAGRDIDWTLVERLFAELGEHLRWLSMMLLFHVNLARLASFQVQNPTRAPGVFEEELALRRLADRMRREAINHTKRLARTQVVQRAITESSSEPDTISISSDKSTTVRGDETGDALGSDAGPTIIDGSSGGIPADVENELTPGSPSHETQKLQFEDANPDRKFENSTTPRTTTEVGEKGEPKNDGGTQHTAPMPPALATRETNPSLPNAVGMSSGAFFQSRRWRQFYSIIPSWFRFSIEPKIRGDKGSLQLQASLLQVGDMSLQRLPFGDKQLQIAYKRLTGGWRGASAWDQFVSLDENLRREVCGAIKRENMFSRRICVGIDRSGLKEYGSIIIFTSPETIRPIYFNDAVGRKFAIPFELCRRWKDMNKIIVGAFRSVESVGSLSQEALDGRYDLVLCETRQTILPPLWESTVKPGARIEMIFWQPKSAPDQPLSHWGRVGHPAPHPVRPPHMVPPRTVFPAARPRPPRPPVPSTVPLNRQPRGIPYFPRPPPGRGLPPGVDIIRIDRPSPPSSRKPTGIEVTGVKKPPECRRSRSDSSFFTLKFVAVEELRRLGVDVDFQAELEKVDTSLGGLLEKWTNAPDVIGGRLDDDSDTEFSDTATSSSGSVVDVA